MSYTPRFKLYESDGVTLVHTFLLVQSTNAPQSVKDMIEITNPRGQGSIIIEGGDAPWNLIISGVLVSDYADATDAYEDLIDKIDDLESIELGTPYVLKINKTSNTYYEYNVKRITNIEYGESFRTSVIPYTITLRANSWSS